MKILVADDHVFYRRLLVSTLAEWDFEPIAVADGEAAWDVLQRDDAPKLAILDWMMPGLDGLEVCRRLRARSAPEPTYVIILTSKGGKENTITALESGADDYVAKPFDRQELHARLRVGRRIVGLQTNQAVVFAFARAAEAKSSYTQGHGERVTRHALRLAELAGLALGDRDVLRQAAWLHDIGKICIPDAVLDKVGPLTPEETAIVQQHPARGVSIVEPLRSMERVLPLIRWHHERIDGGGYPDGLRGNEIPFAVRILSVADVYDALASRRPYRDALPHAERVRLLRENAAGGGLDPGLVEIFVRAGVPETAGTTVNA